MSHLKGGKGRVPEPRLRRGGAEKASTVLEAPGGLAFPEGNVTTFRPGGMNPYNIPWTNAARWEPWFSDAAAEAGVDPYLIVAMAILESDANQYTTGSSSGTHGQVIEVFDSYGGGPSVGIMQVKPFYWQSILPSADAYDPQGNIRLGAKLMSMFINETGSWENAIRQRYHPGPSDVGVTPQMYVDTIKALMAELKAARVSPVEPERETRHPLDIITNGAPWTADFGFGMPNVDENGNPLNLYSYGVGHGTTAANQHTGIDVNLPLGTVLFSPLPGAVRCVGENGQGDWGQGCGSFADTITGGVGNVTILTDEGLKLTFGHVNHALVSVGQRVEAGQPVATSGGMFGPHLHLDVAIRAPERVNHAIAIFGGDYFLLDPVPALREVLGQPDEQPVPEISGIVWEGTNNFHDRGGQEPVAIIYHVTNDRDFANVRQHFQNPGSNASAHFVVTEDGVPHQFVRSPAAAWTNGIINQPRTDIHWLNEAVARCEAGLQNLNDYTLNIETIGIPHQPFATAQIETVLEITRYYLARYPGIRRNRGHMGRHSDIDSVERGYCPGSTFPLADIIRAVGGDPNQLNP